MSVRKWALAGLLPLLAMAGCGAGDGGAWRAERAKGAPAAEAGYLSPPLTLAVGRTADGRVRLSGSAAPGATVRLGQPNGESLSALADAGGGWIAVAPAAADVRLFGLSMTSGGRSVQSEGYLAVLPEGGAAQLRAGAGAQVLSAPSRRPRILAIDHDHDGAAIVSGVGTVGADVGLRVDRAARGASAVDQRGRFTIALNQPLSPGDHEFEVAAEGGEDVIALPISRPVSPASGPFRAERTARGWRIDWMTPGGAVQTTLLIDRAGD